MNNSLRNNIGFLMVSGVFLLATQANASSDFFGADLGGDIPTVNMPKAFYCDPSCNQNIGQNRIIIDQDISQNQQDISNAELREVANYVASQLAPTILGSQTGTYLTQDQFNQTLPSVKTKVYRRLPNGTSQRFATIVTGNRDYNGTLSVRVKLTKKYLDFAYQARTLPEYIQYYELSETEFQAALVEQLRSEMESAATTMSSRN